MKILNFGSCNIDFVYTVEHIVKRGETIAASAVNKYPGGKGLNQSVALSRAGAQIWHAGCIGADGEFLLDYMRESGVNTELVRRVSDSTGQAFIQVSGSGENSIVVYHGANYGVTREYIDEALSHFGAGDFLVLQNEISEVGYLIDRAAEKGMKIILNPSPFDEKMRNADLEKIYCLIVNEVEAAEYSGAEGVTEFKRFLSDKHPRLSAVMTLGSRGSIFFGQDEEIFQPAFEVTVTDTTAAGDTFTGYFLAELSLGHSVKSTLKTASLASAIAVSRAGAASSIPYSAEVISAAKGLMQKKSPHAEEAARTVEIYFKNNYFDANLTSLAKALGYSPSYTARWLKKNTGASFSELLANYRCAAAAELLKSTDTPISEVITATGYCNESFFRKVFRQKYGVSPFKYRKENRKEESK